MSILKGPEGGYSSKRVVGLAYALLGIVMVAHGQFTDSSADFDILLVVVGTALTALGISSITYFGKPSIVNPVDDAPTKTGEATTDQTKPGGPKT